MPPTPRFPITLMPAIFGTAGADLSPLEDFFTIGDDVFGVNCGAAGSGADVEQDMTFEEMKTAITGKLQAYGWYGRTGYAYWEYEGAFNGSWTTQQKKDFADACAQAPGAENLTWLIYHWTWVDMFYADDFNGSPAVITSRNNSELAFIATIDPTRHKAAPDYYAISNDPAPIKHAVQHGWTEQERVLGQLDQTEVYPFTTYSITGTRIPGATLAELLCCLADQGATKIVFWALLHNAGEVSDLNTTVVEAAEALELVRMLPRPTVKQLEAIFTGNAVKQMTNQKTGRTYGGPGIEAGGRINLGTATTAAVTIVDNNGKVLYNATVTADTDVDAEAAGIEGPITVTVASANGSLDVYWSVKK